MSASTGKIALTRLGALAYFLAVLVLGFRVGAPNDQGGWVISAFLVCWSASPIVMALLVARRIPGTLAFWGCFLAIVAIAAIGFAEQWHVLFIGPPDALNALIMVFVPLYQGLAIGLVLAVAWIVGRHVLKS